MSTLELQCRHRYADGFELDLAFALEHPVAALFGPSGSGKTSLLAVIGGLLRPQSGRVRLGERVLLDTQQDLCVPPERRRVGIVFQDHLLFPHLTVEGNLRYGLRHRRDRRAIDPARVVEVLELGPLRTRYPHSLSGGERQRVALGRALMSGPDLLLMDEPLAALDAPLKARILAYLERAIAQWQIPTLFVTHSQAEVRRLAQWVVVVEHGRLVTAGPPYEALAAPRPLAWKDAAGPTNLLHLDELRQAEGHLVGRIGTQSLYLPGADVPSGEPAAFVEFSPADVTLSRFPVPGLSARNHLRGRVCRIVPLPEAVFVAVDVGQVLWAEVTPEAVAELGLQPGVEVTCLLKAHNLHLVE